MRFSAVYNKQEVARDDVSESIIEPHYCNNRTRRYSLHFFAHIGSQTDTEFPSFNSTLDALAAKRMELRLSEKWDT